MLKNTLFLYLRLILVLVINLYTSRIVLSELGISDFGTYSIVASIAVVFGFLNSAMTSSTQRFLSFELGKKNRNNLCNLFSSTVIIHIILAVLILILSETIGYSFIISKIQTSSMDAESVKLVFHMSVLVTIIGVLQVPFTSYIIAKERMDVFSLFSVIEVVFKLLIAYSLSLFIKDKIVFYSLLLLLLAFFILLSYVIFCFLYFKELKFRFYYEKKLYAELLSFSGWNIFGNLAVYGKGHGINIILNFFFSSIINASYALSMQVNGAASLFLSSMQLAIGPRIVKSFASNNLDYMKTLIERFSKYSFLLMCLITIPLCLNIDEILKLWLGIVPELTSMFVNFTLIALLIDSFSGPLLIAVQATGKVKMYQIIVGGFILLNLPLSYLALKFFPQFGIHSIVYIPIIINIIILVIRLYFLHHLLQINVFSFVKKVLLPCTLVLASFFVLYHLLSMSSLPLFFEVASILLTLIILIFLFALKSEEYIYIKSIIKK